MNEQDLQLARALVAEEKENNCTPGNSPTPLKKSFVGRAQEKIFRYFFKKKLYIFLYY